MPEIDKPRQGLVDFPLAMYVLPLLCYTFYKQTTSWNLAGDIMQGKKIVRIILDILIAVLLFYFIFSLYWFINGSFEMVPTEEQQEKARLGAMLLMIGSGVPCIACIVARVNCRKRL